MDKQEIKALLDRYYSGTATTQERALIEIWYNLLPYDAGAPDHETIMASKVNNWEGVVSRTKPAKERLWPRIGIAAAVVAIIFSAGLFFYKNQQKDVTQNITATNDIAPGKAGATLTLANGRKIRLRDALNGKLADDAGVQISKTADGQLVYEIKEASGEPGKINTLSTARGETYQLRLPDGSVVWLNSASSLTYSSNLFQDGKRVVQLTGEGYFEVAKDKAHPFVVQASGQRVEVLGTEFNVNSYTDEPYIRTTLAEGSVKINNDIVLKPGQQAIANQTGIAVRNISAEAFTDWKNGIFSFENEGLKSVMRKIARWYDVEVQYKGEEKDHKTYSGSISKYGNISTVLRLLQESEGIHFKVEGRVVTVVP